MSANGNGKPRLSLGHAAGCIHADQTELAFPRRHVLAGGAAALGLGALGFGRTLPAAAQAAAKARIDVHHHFIPPFHVEAMAAPGRRVGGRPPAWTPQMSLEEMDKSGIATSIPSIAQPGVLFGKDFETAINLLPRLKA